jgi:hypothetical protein
MTIRSPVRVGGAALFLWLATLGCQPNVDQLVPVKGKITYKGVPLQGGRVVFVPDGARGTHGSLADADVQPDGTFTLKTNETFGAAAGWYKITVNFVQRGAPGQHPQSVLPARFRDPQQSGLVREIVANKINAIELDLD